MCKSYLNYAISNHLSHYNLSPNLKNLIININSHSNPRSFKEAISQSCWQEAINAKLTTFMANKTWTLCALPKKKKNDVQDGFLKQNLRLMASLTNTRRSSWQRAILKHMI
jgi:hypothetical protein